METLLSFLVLTSLVLLIVGLINPAWVKPFLRAQVSRKKVALIFGGLVFLLAFIVGITAPNKAVSSQTPQATNSATPIVTTTLEQSVQDTQKKLQVAISQVQKDLPPATATPTSAKPMTLEEKVKSKLGLPSDIQVTSLTIDDAADLTTFATIPGKKAVSIELLLKGTYWNISSTKQAGLNIATDIYKNVFPLEDDIYAVQVTFNVPAQDAYEKNNNAQLETMTISHDTFDKIDFQNFKPENLPTIADIYFDNKNLHD